MIKALHVGTVALLLSATLACGQGPNATPPTVTLPSPTAVAAGQWVGDAVLRSVTGAVTGVYGCVGGVLNANMATAPAALDRLTLSITQDATTTSARVTSSTSGLSCTMTGTTRGSSLVLDSSSCQSSARTVLCPVVSPTGAVSTGTYSMLAVGSSITAQLSGDLRTMAGTIAAQYNVSGPSSEGLVLTYDYSAQKQ